MMNMMTGPDKASNSYDTVKTRRRNPRQTLPVPSSSSDEGEELGQNREAGEPSVPPSHNSGQPGTSPPRIPKGQVKIRNTYKKNRNPNTNPTGTQIINQTPIGTHGTNHTLTGTTSGKQKRSESKGRRGGWSKILWILYPLISGKVSEIWVSKVSKVSKMLAFFPLLRYDLRHDLVL